MTTLPTVALDDELLAVLSVGVPIGLGIYWAWVRSDWSATTKTAGLVAALGGTLLGAWLGFHATAGLVALITAIVGATVGANLLLIALDISGPDRFVIVSRRPHRHRHLQALGPEAAQNLGRAIG